MPIYEVTMSTEGAFRYGLPLGAGGIRIIVEAANPTEAIESAMDDLDSFGADMSETYWREYATTAQAVPISVIYEVVK